jgi:hypothetical protein
MGVFQIGGEFYSHRNKMPNLGANLAFSNRFLAQSYKFFASGA